jgi:hypothetical protein
MKNNNFFDAKFVSVGLFNKLKEILEYNELFVKLNDCEVSYFIQDSKEKECFSLNGYFNEEDYFYLPFSFTLNNKKVISGCFNVSKLDVAKISSGVLYDSEIMDIKLLNEYLEKENEDNLIDVLCNGIGIQALVMFKSIFEQELNIDFNVIVRTKEEYLKEIKKEKENKLICKFNLEYERNKNVYCNDDVYNYGSLKENTWVSEMFFILDLNENIKYDIEEKISDQFKIIDFEEKCIKYMLENKDNILKKESKYLPQEQIDYMLDYAAKYEKEKEDLTEEELEEFAKEFFSKNIDEDVKEFSKEYF